MPKKAKTKDEVTLEAERSLKRLREQKYYAQQDFWRQKFNLRQDYKSKKHNLEERFKSHFAKLDSEIETVRTLLKK